MVTYSAQPERPIGAPTYTKVMINGEANNNFNILDNLLSILIMSAVVDYFSQDRAFILLVDLTEMTVYYTNSLQSSEATLIEWNQKWQF